MQEYKRKGTALLRRGQVPYTQIEAERLAYRAMSKRRARAFLSALFEKGEAVARWQAFSFYRAGRNNWAQLHGTLVAGQYRFFISGPWSGVALRRINRLQNVESLRMQTLTTRVAKKKKCKNPKKQRDQQNQQPKQKRQRSHRCEDLTPQFRNSCLEWDDALDLTRWLFDIQCDSKSTARQIAARRLYDSLEKSSWQWAHYEQGGFTLHFEAIGPWLVDTTTNMVKTKVRVFCVKNNKNAVYRRLRKHLRKHRRLFETIPRKLRLAGFFIDKPG